MLYFFVKIWAKVVFFFFYSRLEIIGRKNIPRVGGVIFAPNHQGAFMDAVLVGTYTRRKVTFLTRADVFKKWTQPILRSLGMTPIYRIRDGYQSLSQNDAVFKACFDLLSREKSILIFPEGNHSPDHFLRPLSKGTSRLALDARDQIASDLKLYIVPTGINYFSHTRPWSKVTLVYGDPIDLSGYATLYRENNQKAFNALREDLDKAMRATLILHEKTTDHEERKRYIFNRKHERLKFEEIKKIAEGPIVPTPQKRRSGIRSVLAGFFAIFNFFPLFLLSRILGKVKDKAFYLSIKCFAGSVLFLFWWILLFILGSQLLGWELGSLLIATSVLFAYARQDLIGYGNDH